MPVLSGSVIFIFNDNKHKSENKVILFILKGVDGSPRVYIATQGLIHFNVKIRMN